MTKKVDKVSASDPEAASRASRETHGSSPAAGAIPPDPNMTVDPATNSHRTDEHERVGGIERTMNEDPFVNADGDVIYTVIDAATGQVKGAFVADALADFVECDEELTVRAGRLATNLGDIPVVFATAATADAIVEPDIVPPDAFIGMGADVIRGHAMTALLEEYHGPEKPAGGPRTPGKHRRRGKEGGSRK